MAQTKKVTVLGFGAYGKPLRGYGAQAEDLRGNIRAAVVLDYLKGRPVADSTLSIDQALRLQVELANAIHNALAHREEREASDA